MITRAIVILPLVILSYAGRSLTGTVLEVARANRCGAFVDLIDQAGLTNLFESESNVTLFAPAVSKQVLQDILFRQYLAGNSLEQFLMYHLAKGVKLSADVQDEELVDTYEKGHATLRLNKYTYHGGRGNEITADGSHLSDKDLDQLASNGVVQILHSPITFIPRQDIMTALKTDTGVISADFGVMVMDARLNDTLAGQSFTVFAPSHEAVQRLHGQEFQDFSGNVTALRDIISYHVVQGTYYFDRLLQVDQVTTLHGEELQIAHHWAGSILSLSVNADAMVTSTLVHGDPTVTSSIHCTNGVIHVLDRVLFPSSYAHLDHLNTGTHLG